MTDHIGGDAPTVEVRVPSTGGPDAQPADVRGDGADAEPSGDVAADVADAGSPDAGAAAAADAADADVAVDAGDGAAADVPDGAVPDEPDARTAVRSAAADDAGAQPEAAARGAVAHGPDAGPPGTGRDLPDVIIDLTGGGGRGGSMTRDRRLLLVVGAVALVAVVLAVTNFVFGTQWRARALADAQRAERATAAAEARQQELAQARTAVTTAELRQVAISKHLEVSEADVAALEARVAALASSRARAEDYGNYRNATDSRRQMRALRTQVDSCVTQVAALRADLQLDGGSRAVLREAARAAEAACEQIGADAATLVARE